MLTLRKLEISVTHVNLMYFSVLQAVFSGFYFANYFDIVTRYEAFKSYGNQVILNPTSHVWDYDSRGMQAIHYAVETGNFGATVALIKDFNANINSKTIVPETGQGPKAIPSGSTPLIISIIIGNSDIFCYLFSNPALNVNEYTDQFKSALHFAAELGHMDMVQALLAKNAVSILMKRTRMTPFHSAVKSGNVEIADFLCQHDFGLGIVVSDGKYNTFESMVHFLARQRFSASVWIKMLEIVIRATAKLDAKSRAYNVINVIDRNTIFGHSPLKIAVEEKNEIAIAGLIVYGAKMGVNEGFDPLVVAVHGFFGTNPVCPDYLNSDNESIWHLCARINSVPLIQVSAAFFTQRTNLLTINSRDQTALNLAIEMQNVEIAVELLKMYHHSISIDSLELCANVAVWNSWPVMMETLIEEFPEEFSDLVTSNRIQFLHHIATFQLRDFPVKETKQLFLILVKKFPDTLRSLNRFGNTPLHVALQSGFLLFFEWLMEAKRENLELDFNVADSSGVLFLDFLKNTADEAVLNILMT